MSKAIPISRNPGERQYQVEDALRTIKRAEQIKSDPKMMREVKNLAKQEQKAISKIVSSKPTSGRGRK